METSGVVLGMKERLQDLESDLKADRKGGGGEVSQNKVPRD